MGSLAKKITIGSRLEGWAFIGVHRVNHRCLIKTKLIIELPLEVTSHPWLVQWRSIDVTSHMYWLHKWHADPQTFAVFSGDKASGDQDRPLIKNTIHVAQSIFPSILCTAFVDVISLLDDHAVSLDGTAVYEVAYQVRKLYLYRGGGQLMGDEGSYLPKGMLLSLWNYKSTPNPSASTECSDVCF